MNIIEHNEEKMAPFGDFYHIGGGIYECRDTGIRGTYEQIVGASKPVRKSTAVGAQTTAVRNSIADFGYRALTGSKKQKEWAEKIRQQIVLALPEAVRSAFTDAPFASAKFWIENRDRRPSEFAKFAGDDIALHDEIWTLHDAGEFRAAQKLVDKRNLARREWKI